MAGTQSLTDQIRDWFNRTPKAQRAVKRLSDDLDVVAGKVEQATSGLLERVGPIIDPPSRLEAPEQAGSVAEASGAEQDTGAATPEPGSSIPPGVKQDEKPIDPTT